MKTFLVRAGGYGGGIGDVVYTENGSSGEREYFLYNAIGSTSALTDDSGSVINTTNYGAWGAETGTTGSSENVRKFSTKERSASIGLDYFGFRYYDYDLGRFTTRDPSGYPDGPNNYLYCDNNPVNKIDPLGLESSGMVIAFGKNRKIAWNLSGRLTRNRDMVNEELREEGGMAIDTEPHDNLEKIGAVTSTFVRGFTEELADNSLMGDVAAVVNGTHPGTNEPISPIERSMRGASLVPGMGVVGKGAKTAIGRLKRVADKGTEIAGNKLAKDTAEAITEKAAKLAQRQAEAVKQWTSADLLEDHFLKHRKQFVNFKGELRYTTKEAFAKASNDLLSRAGKDKGVIQKIGQNGKLYVFEKSSGTLVIKGPNGIESMFKPDAGIKYFNRQ